MGDYAKASELQYGRIPELEKRIAALESGGADAAGPRMLKEEVDEEDIAEVVAKWTHIPVSKLMEGEVQKLLQMETRLHQRVIGQDEAVVAVANAIRRARAGLQDAQPSARQLPVPRPDRRRQDRAGARAGRLPVRRRPGDGPHRHVGVPGEAQRRADDRRASGLRRLRGGRPADRSRAPAAVLGGAARRDREGAPRGAERAAAAARRRAADRRQGPHGRLPPDGRDHDVERRQPRAGGERRPRRRHRRGHAPRGHGRGARALPPRVPEPRRRDHPVPPARPQPHGRDRRHPARRAGQAAGRTEDHGPPHRRGAGAPGRGRLRPGLRRAAAEADDPAAAARSAGDEGAGRRLPRRRHGGRRRRRRRADLRGRHACRDAA